MTDIERQLRTFLQDVAKKQRYNTSEIKIKPINSGGANFTSDLYVATIQDSIKPDLHLFAKAACLNEDTRTKNNFLDRIYATEEVFYTDLAVHFNRIYNERAVPTEDRLLVPKFYGLKSIPYEEILVLENLEGNGFTSFDRRKIFDWEYAAAAVSQMAKFHAVSLALRDQRPKEFELIINNFGYHDSSKGQDKIIMYMQQALRDVYKVLNDDYKTRLVDFFRSVNMGTLMQRLTADKRFLIHGDFKTPNLMHRRNNNKLEVILLDYQTLKLGNPVMDLMYFIFSGSDEEFRRRHYQQLLDHYFIELTMALEKLHIDVEKVYPRKKFDMNLEEMKPLGLLLSLLLVGIVTAEPEDAPKFGGDLSQMQVKLNQLAQERFSGIVADFIRWGVL
ncbi:uncharacterized protein LOC125234413 [Leguminivora glycinivorella]|uniref:uncharacterized protein LOC125234413 n=1 Tax=Leguminivora glycinivorella TaxID=1035111 RepID=UPI00200F7479|nr:uncharacterized protein LOC125234413 [Leguminivora glycinivorella]